MKRAVDSAKKFLASKDYEVIAETDVCGKPAIAAMEKGTDVMHICFVSLCRDVFRKDVPKDMREDFENTMLHLAKCGFINTGLQIVCGDIQIIRVDENRALLRFNRNAL